MKRRKFFQYAMGSACFSGMVGREINVAQTAPLAPAQARYKWAVLYWMPYDNDLSHFGEPIIEMLACGTQNTEVVVAVQSDYWGKSQMRRRQMIKGTVTEIKILEEDSSDNAALVVYLDWAHQTFEAEHWAVIVVGHGGKINELSPDDHPNHHQTRTWMSVDQFAKAVSQFNQSIHGQVELLYFQNCNKATLEVIYEARDCARYTLASQLTLGAPNYYYEDWLKHLDALADGREAAVTIMNTERADMYHTLTLVDNQAVEGIPEKLSKLLHPILKSRLPSLSQLNISTYPYFGELHCDALMLFKGLSEFSERSEDELIEFSDFLKTSVIVSHQTGGQLFGPPLPHSESEALCGLGLFFPETQQDVSRYSSLALYQSVDLVGLYTRLVEGQPNSESAHTQALIQTHRLSGEERRKW